MKVIETENLSKVFDNNIKALENLNLEINEGDIFGFFGPNGSGKTTTIRLLNGVLEPSFGHANLFGIPVSAKASEIRKMCGVLTESAGIYNKLSAIDNLKFFGRLNRLSDDVIKERALKLFNMFELTEFKDRRVENFSTGMKKKLLLAVAMLHGPRLVFLDEPTSGLDPETSRNVNELIYTMAKNEGVTVFLCTHQLKYAEGLCSIYGFIREGRLLASGRLKELQKRYNTSLTLEIRGENIHKKLGFKETGKGIYRREIEDDQESWSVIKQIVDNNGTIYQAEQIEASLEDLYFAIQKEEENV
ncbi:ABC transporter ATP-binding protein [Candidatus Riflebacteria bacterium]